MVDLVLANRGPLGHSDRQIMEALEQQLAALRAMEEEITAEHPEPRAESAAARQLATIHTYAYLMSLVTQVTP